MNSFNKNLLTALFILSASSGLQTANAAATAQATIDWSSFNVQIVDLSGGLNTPVFNWLTQNGTAYSSSYTITDIDNSPRYDTQEQILEASDFSTVLSANTKVALGQSNGLRDANILQANSAASGSINGFVPVADTVVRNSGDFELTGKGYALMTVDWALSTSEDEDIPSLLDYSVAHAGILGYYFGSRGNSNGHYSSTIDITERIYSDGSIRNSNGTFVWAVINTGEQNITGRLNFDVSTYAYYGTKPIPVPAATWLFASGLIGWLGLSHRRSVIS